MAQNLDFDQFYKPYLLFFRFDQNKENRNRNQKLPGTRGQASNWIQEHYADRSVRSDPSLEMREAAKIFFLSCFPIKEKQF